MRDNTALHHTLFTVSVDLIGHGTTTGISASDRSKTIQALIGPGRDPLTWRGRIHLPPKAKEGGVRGAPTYRGSGGPGAACRDSNPPV